MLLATSHLESTAEYSQSRMEQFGLIIETLEKFKNESTKGGFFGATHNRVELSGKRFIRFKKFQLYLIVNELIPELQFFSCRANYRLIRDQQKTIATAFWVAPKKNLQK